MPEVRRRVERNLISASRPTGCEQEPRHKMNGIKPATEFLSSHLLWLGIKRSWLIFMGINKHRRGSYARE